MSESPLFTVKCPCCQAKLDIDPKTKSIFNVEKKGMKKRTFEEVVEDVSAVPARAAEKFEKGLETQAKHKEKLEELSKLFDAETEKAKKGPIERPRSIFDLD